MGVGWSLGRSRSRLPGSTQDCRSLDQEFGVALQAAGLAVLGTFHSGNVCKEPDSLKSEVLGSLFLTPPSLSADLLLGCLASVPQMLIQMF